MVDASLRRIPEYYKKENELFANTHPNSSPYIYNKETLGFRLDSAKEIAVFRDAQEPQHYKIENFLDYSIHLIKTFMDAQSNQHLHDRKSTRLNSSHVALSRMPPSA